MTLATNIVLGVAAGVLLVSALVAVNRVAAGPSQLDRSVAADLIVAVVIAALGLWTVWTDQPTELLVLVLLSACSGKNKELERGIALRTKMLGSPLCSYDADIVYE